MVGGQPSCVRPWTGNVDAIFGLTPHGVIADNPVTARWHDRAAWARASRAELNVVIRRTNATATLRAAPSCHSGNTAWLVSGRRLASSRAPRYIPWRHAGSGSSMRLTILNGPK